MILLWCFLIFLLAGKTSPLADQQDLENLIYTIAIKHDVNPKLLTKIAKCESGLRIEAKNSKSSASGIMQFLDSTFINEAHAYGLPTDDKNNAQVQLEIAARMIAGGKIRAWNSSRHCWSK